MNQPSKSCHLCDGTSYYLDSGFYYCSECNTRNEGVQEVAFEEIDPAFHGKTHTIRLKRKQRGEVERDETNSWTSWHGHNYVLVGMVDELIALGADPSFKFVVLQLWTKYLNILEAAFISTTDEELPKFGLKQCEKDYELIYGIKKARKTYLKKRASKDFSLKKSVERAVGDDADQFEKVRLFRRMRRVVVKTHYEELRKQNLSITNAMKRLDDRLNDTLTQPDEFKEPEPPKKVIYNSEAHRVMGRRYQMLIKRGKDDDAETQTPETATGPNFYNIHYLTRIKLLGLIAIALRICKQDIQISDLLRWIYEGHLSYTNVTHLFPPHLRFSQGDRIFLTPPSVLPTYSSMQRIMLNIARSLSIPGLPKPDTMSLVRRYLRELALPSSLISNVERLAASVGPFPPPTRMKQLENHEAYAMALVIIVLKMVLALDGFTEHRISDVAKAVNRLPAQTHPLFVWDDWVKFVECRKATISHEHFASRARLQGEASRNVDPYLSFLEKGWKKTEGLEDKIQPASRHARTHRMSTKIGFCIDQIPDFKPTEANSLTFQPTLTPLTSYLERIAQAERLKADILLTDFTRTSVEYLFQPKETLRLAKREGLPVKFCHGTALKSYLVIPKVGCTTAGGRRKATVKLKDYGPAPEQKDSIELLDTEAEELVLFIPHKHYWLLECDDHTESVTREFENRVLARLSDTFQWLLAECSAVIEMTTKELYSHIVHVERLMVSPVF